MSVATRGSIADHLQETCPDAWAACSDDGLPIEPEFLSPSFIEDASSFVGLSEPHRRRSLQCAEIVRQGPDLLRAIRVIHEDTYYPADRKLDRSALPVPSELPTDLAGHFYVVLLLSGLPRVKSIHKRLGVDEALTRETVHDLERRLSYGPYVRAFGEPGIDGYNFGWLLMIWDGELFQIGRFQFSLWTHPGTVRVYRNAVDGCVVALSADGLEYLASGLNMCSGGVSDREGGWAARLVETDTEIVGFPISSDGHARDREIRLAKTEWSEILSEGTSLIVRSPQLSVPPG